MRFPLSTGMAKNGNFIPVIERNRALIPGPKGNDGNKGGEYFPLRANTTLHALNKLLHKNTKMMKQRMQ